MYKFDHSGNLFQAEIIAINEREGTATVKKKLLSQNYVFDHILTLFSHVKADSRMIQCKQCLTSLNTLKTEKVYKTYQKSISDT